MKLRDLARRLKDKNPQEKASIDEIVSVLSILDKWTHGVFHIVLAFIPGGKRK